LLLKFIQKESFKRNILCDCKLQFDSSVRAQVQIGLSEAEPVSERSNNKYLNNNNEIEAQLDGLAAANTHPSIAALAEACSETLLNPSYLLRGIGNPFADKPGATVTAPPLASQQRPALRLHSRKMAGLKEVLMAEKLNTSAISLQLTAQSQVQVGGRKTRAAEPPPEQLEHAASKAKKAKTRD
jgi:menin